jgi:hypothetical protein
LAWAKSNIVKADSLLEKAAAWEKSDVARKNLKNIEDHVKVLDERIKALSDISLTADNQSIPGALGDRRSALQLLLDLSGVWRSYQKTGDGADAIASWEALMANPECTMKLKQMTMVPFCVGLDIAQIQAAKLARESRWGEVHSMLDPSNHNMKACLGCLSGNVC